MHAARFSAFLDRAVEFVISRRTPIFWGLLVASLLGAIGIAQIRVENNFRAFVGGQNDALQTNDWLTQRQGQGLESVILIYRPADRDAFSTVSLLQYTQLATRARQLPHAKDATSWLDLDKLVEVAVPGGANGAGELQRKAAPFLYGLDVLSPEGVAVLKADALASPAVAGRYVARDGATAAVVVSVNLGDGAASRRIAVDELMAGVAAIETQLRAVAPGDSVSIAGTTLFDHAAFLILRKDLRTLFPLAVLMVLVVLFAIYRSVPFVALFMLLTLLPVVTTAGLCAWFGVEFSNLSIAGLLLVGTLAVADIMHISNSFFLEVGRGMPKERALRYAFRHNLFAVTATTSTTVMGEATLFFTSPPPVQAMGVIVIIGSALALFLALTMLPYALAVVRPVRSDTLLWLTDAMAAVAEFSYRHAKAVLGTFTAIVLACAAAIPASRIDDSLQGWFGERTTFHRDLALLKDQYLGNDTIVLALEVRPEDMIAARLYTNAAPAAGTPTALYADLDKALREAGGPGQWLSIVTVAQARRARLDSGAPTGYRAADPAQAAALKPFTADALTRAGLMTRYEPGRADYSLWYFHSLHSSSFALTETARRLHAVMAAHAQGRDVRSGGVGVAIAQVSVSNLQSVLSGTVFVFALIMLSMFAVFRSVWLGAISLIPNVAPVVFSFGLWAFFAGEINMAAVTVLGVAFGIVVDDTIHVLSKYKENLAAGHDGMVAIRESFREGGVGILATSLILAGGFALLGASDFLLTAQRCQLAALTIASALVFDLLMLPALLCVAARVSSRLRGRAVLGAAG